MGKGAKKGQNRFKASKDAIIEYRLSRLTEYAIPKLKALSLHAKVKSTTAFTKLCAITYNENLPINEKPITYRTIKQNDIYWNAVGPIYYKYFEKNESLEAFKSDAIVKLENKELAESFENKCREVDALAAMLSKVTEAGHIPQMDTPSDTSEKNKDLDKVCRVILSLIEASDGVILVDLKKAAIRNLADDCESSEGILPKSDVQPFIKWLIRRNERLSRN